MLIVGNRMLLFHRSVVFAIDIGKARSRIGQLRDNVVDIPRTAR